jgi:outer membrane protein assembly factor BamB
MNVVKYLLAALLTFSSLPALAATQTLLGVVGGSELTDSSAGGSPGAVTSIDQATAAVTVLGTPVPEYGLTGVAVNSQGRVFVTTGGSANGPRLIEVNPQTGLVVQNVGRLQRSGEADCYVGDLSFQPGTDVLFGILARNKSNCGITSGTIGGTLVTINTATAAVTVVGHDDTNVGDSNGGLAFAPDGTLYFTPCGNSGVLLTLNPATGKALTTQNLSNEGECYQGMGVRADGTIFVSYDDDYNIYTLNPATGARTLVGSTGENMIHDLVFLAPIVVQQVPTLSEWVLFALGTLVALSGAAWLRRRTFG